MSLFPIAMFSNILFPRQNVQKQGSPKLRSKKITEVTSSSCIVSNNEKISLYFQKESTRAGKHIYGI